MEEETAEEAGKYGKLKRHLVGASTEPCRWLFTRCVIKELAGKPDDEVSAVIICPNCTRLPRLESWLVATNCPQAVRIFLEYEDVSAATKAVDEARLACIVLGAGVRGHERSLLWRAGGESSILRRGALRTGRATPPEGNDACKGLDHET